MKASWPRPAAPWATCSPPCPAIWARSSGCAGWPGVGAITRRSRGPASSSAVRSPSRPPPPATWPRRPRSSTAISAVPSRPRASGAGSSISTPEHPIAFKRAHELLAAADDVPGLIALLGRKIVSLGPSAAVVAHRLERAALLRRKGAHDAAAEDLEAVLELEPGRVDALLALAEVRLAQGNARAAAELLGQYNDTVNEPEQRADGELRLARVFEEMGDRAGAIGAYEMVLTARSDDLPARERLIELLLTDGAYARAGEEMERLAQRRGDRAVRARDELRAARVYRDHVGDQARARKAYERSLVSDPLSLEALRELAAITEGSARSAVLERAAGDVRALVTGTEAQPLKVLAATAALAGDDTLALSACGALEALGAASDDERRRYLTERGRASAAPLRPRRAVSDDEWRTRIEHPGVRGGSPTPGPAWPRPSLASAATAIRPAWAS